MTNETLTGTSDEPAILQDGAGVSAETGRRLACDARVEDHAGRMTRKVSAALARALRRRDPTCRFPGCTSRAFLDAHHIHHWARGGATTLDNLIHLCTFHHAYVHDHDVAIRDEGFFDRAGRRIEPIPSRARPVDYHWRAADVPTPGWNGLPVDYGAVIDALLE